MVFKGAGGNADRVREPKCFFVSNVFPSVKLHPVVLTCESFLVNGSKRERRSSVSPCNEEIHL